eukprot:gene14284-biopygen14169
MNGAGEVKTDLTPPFPSLGVAGAVGQRVLPPVMAGSAPGTALWQLPAALRRGGEGPCGARHLPGRNGSGRVRDASVSSNSIVWDASGTRPQPLLP